MSTEIPPQQLFDDFRQFLEQNRLEEPGIAPPDLQTLLGEMAGLKAEVKAESRQFKATLDTLAAALTAVQDDNKTLAAELAAQAERLMRQQHERERAMLLEMVEIYERLQGGYDALQNYRPATAPFRRSKARDVRFVKQMQEGQAMTLRRFEQCLQRCQVRAIDCRGKALDPATMRAVETGNDPQCGNGIVLEELRKGFFYRDQLLRPAEVKVNKLTHG